MRGESPVVSDPRLLTESRCTARRCWSVPGGMPIGLHPDTFRATRFSPRRSGAARGARGNPGRHRLPQHRRRSGFRATCALDVARRRHPDRRTPLQSRSTAWSRLSLFGRADQGRRIRQLAGARLRFALVRPLQPQVLPETRSSGRGGYRRCYWEPRRELPPRFAPADHVPSARSSRPARECGMR